MIPFDRFFSYALVLATTVTLSFAATVAVSDEAMPATALAPVCDEDAHRDGAHQPIDLETFEGCMGTDSDGESWSLCHHADFNCDGVIGIPDFNLFRTAVAGPEEGA